MSTREINLIKERESASPAEKQLRSRLTLVLVLASTVYLLAFGFVVIFSSYLDSKFSSLETSIEGEKSSIENLKRDEGLYSLLKQKTEAISSILTSRFPFADEYSFFANLNIPGARLMSTSISDQGQITVAVQLSDLVSVDEYVNKLLTAAEQEFSAITLKNTELNEDHTYTLDFAITSKGNK